jgi:hypothetical protein
VEGEETGTVWQQAQQLTFVKYILKLYFNIFQVLSGTRFEFWFTECSRSRFIVRFNVSGLGISLRVSL